MLDPSALEIAGLVRPASSGSSMHLSKRALLGTAALTAVVGLGLGTAAPAGSVLAPAPAAAASAKSYKNCTQLNAKYKHGVEKSAGTKDVVRSGGKTIKRNSQAYVSKSLYNANKGLDRDKDGIACEKK
jgi:hypothetical protein